MACLVTTTKATGSILYQTLVQVIPFSLVILHPRGMACRVLQPNSCSRCRVVGIVHGVVMVVRGMSVRTGPQAKDGYGTMRGRDGQIERRLQPRRQHVANQLHRRIALMKLGICDS